MSHEQLLLARVGALRTRIRLLLAQQGACVGLTYATVGGLLLVACTRFQWWTDAIDYLWALLLLGAVTGILVGWTRHITPLVAAQIADERAGLKERLSTAVELSGNQNRSEIATAQIADAAQHASGMQPSRVLPWRVPRQWRFLAAAAAVLLAAIFLPELPVFHTPQDRIDRAEMQNTGAKIQQVAKEMEKKARKRQDDKNSEILHRIAREMKQLGKDQERNRISKKQAMLRMNDLQKQVKEAESQPGSGNSQKSMDKVARELRDAAKRQAQRGNPEAQQALNRMADNMEKRDFDGAKKQLEELAQKMQSGKLSADEAGKAAETLQQMAQSMEGSNMQNASKQMKDAAKQLQQAAQAAKQLQQKMAGAKSDAERQKLQQQASQQLSQAMQQAGQQTHQAGGT
jgi:hypothetical protein